MKAIGKLFKILAKTISLAIFLAVAIPVTYFAVRMGQPMDLPEYKGLTYYQYLKWESLEYEKLGEAYRINNPTPATNVDAGVGCNINARLFGHIGPFFSQPLVTVFEAKKFDTTIDTTRFFPNWWAGFEKGHLQILRGNSMRHPICRIPSVIPDDYALSVGAQLPGMVQE